MSFLTTPTLEIDADVDGDGTAETGVFELAPIDDDTREALTGMVRTGYLLQGAFDTLSALGNDVLQTGDTSRKGIHIDLGGGEYAYQIDFSRPIDATVDGSNLPQWGDGSGTLPSDATGSSNPGDYEQIFMYYLRTGKVDSDSPARFKFGQIHSGGALDNHLDVAIEQPQITSITGEQAVSISMTLVATIDLNKKIDAVLNDGK